jgi:hypothetical protein
MNNFEIITTLDKDQRDRMYQDFKMNGNDLEKQAVKFSDCEPVLDESGNQKVKQISYDKAGPSSVQTRPVYQTTYSVAYPRS